MPYKLYLDDIRTPNASYPTTNNSEWVIARSFSAFVHVLKTNGLPFMVSFDHDLADEHYRQSMYSDPKKYTSYYDDGTFKEKTGYDCAKYLVDYCIEHNLPLPKWKCHSMNPVGKRNIEQLLTRFEEAR